MYQYKKRDGDSTKWLAVLPRQPYQKKPPLTKWQGEFWVPNGYWDGKNSTAGSFVSTHKDYPHGVDNCCKQQHWDDKAKEKLTTRATPSCHSLIQWFLRPHNPCWMVYLNFLLDTNANWYSCQTS